MEILKRTREFFAHGGIIFSGSTNFLSMNVAALGLSAVVSIFPAEATNTQPNKPPIIENSVANKLTNISLRSDQSLTEKSTTQLLFQRISDWKKQSTAEIDLKKYQDAPATSDVTPSVVTSVLNETATLINYHVEQLSINASLHDFGDYKVPHYIAKEIIRAANDTNFPVDTLFAIAEKESSFNIEAKPATSSAYGLMQFLDQKWLEMVKGHGDKYGLEYEASLIQERTSKRGFTEYFIPNKLAEKRVLDLRTSPYLSSVFAAINLLDAKQRIEARINKQLSNDDLYLPHFLGTNGAGSLIEKSDKRPRLLARNAFPKAASANRNMFKGKGGKSLTVRQFHEQARSVITQRSKKYNNVEEIIADTTNSNPIKLVSNPIEGIVENGLGNTILTAFIR